MAKEAFCKVDHETWKMLWRWAKRRHPNRGAQWVKDRYFRTEDSRTRVFAESLTAKDGALRTVKLVKASDTKIQRHVKIRGEANPVDPNQEAYFEDRLGWKMKDSLTGQAKLLRLWWSQNKQCPICGEHITKDSGWNVHHLLPKFEGGKDSLSNLVLAHPTCHRQIHSRS